MRLTAEQPGSAHEMLRVAGVRHGDLTRVQMAIGVPDEGDEHVAFCPGVARPVQVLSEGSREDHALPITGDIEFTNGHEIARRLYGRRGILTFTADVLTNGHVAITVLPETVELHTVSYGDAMHLRSATGKPVARRALEALAS